MPVDVRLWVQLDVAENLHAYDGVYEKQHADQQTDVGQCLWAREEETDGEKKEKRKKKKRSAAG